jgi:Divergent InlB B-repeat domain
LLDVLKDPKGQVVGTVTSNPPGINCGLLCLQQSARFPHGTVVRLTAEATTGTSFLNWTGDCTGTAACTVTMTADRTVVAHFSLSQRPAEGDSKERAPKLALRSRLILSGGRGEIAVGGRTVSVAAGAESETALDATPGDHVVEAWAREGAGEGVWRFYFGPGDPADRRILNVLAGEPVTLTPDAVVFRVKGRLPRRVAFVVRVRGGGASPPR